MKNIATDDYERIKDNLQKSDTSPDEYLDVEEKKKRKQRMEEILEED
jgi:hypothetical protein